MCVESIGRGFARRYGVDIYCPRMRNMIEPFEYAEENGLFSKYLFEPEKFKIHA